MPVIRTINPRTAGLGAFMTGMVEAGTSASAALRAFRGAGERITTQVWFRIYRNVKETVAARDMVMNIAPNVLPSNADFGHWQTSGRDQYAYGVDLLVRDFVRNEYFVFPSMVLSDTVITFEEALAIAEGRWIEGAEFDATNYPLQLQTTVPRNLLWTGPSPLT